MEVAYALTAAYEGTVTAVVDGREQELPRFTGGLVNIGPSLEAPDKGDRTLDLRAELDAGDGVIVVDESDTGAVLALDESPALKKVAVPERAKDLGAPERRTVAELKAELERRGVPIPVDARKPDLLNLLAASKDPDPPTGDEGELGPAGEAATTSEADWTSETTTTSEAPTAP
jgi:hypothetical protein